MGDDKFIACGMYAFNDGLKNAWQELFDHFYPLLAASTGVVRELVFSHSESVLRDHELFIGHTCGYPLMTRLRDDLIAFCVPVYDVPGTEEQLYSSHIVVPAASDINSLQECRAGVAAINTTDSNSGMNVLRYEIARLGASPGFFSRVEISGGHMQSLETVAANRAQVAAIDCVSFQLIADQDPELVAAVRSIGYCERSCGLPFVMRRQNYSEDYAGACIEALNQALGRLSAASRQRLHLSYFETAEIGDYQSILEFETFAVDAGYPELN